MQLKNIAYGTMIAVAAVAIALGSAEAKGKKRAAAAAAAPAATPWCMFGQTQPVCAAKGKQKFTYATACFAAKDGAKVVSQKACATKAAKKGGGKKKSAKKAAKKKAKM